MYEFCYIIYSEFLQNIGPIEGESSKKVLSKTALDAAQEYMALPDEHDEGEALSQKSHDGGVLQDSPSRSTAVTDDDQVKAKQAVTHSSSSFAPNLSPIAIKKMLELLCDESVSLFFYFLSFLLMFILTL